MQPLGRGHVWSHPRLPSGCTPMPPTAALRSGPTTPHQANQLMGLGPGEVFVQRNVGNLVTHKDMNAMSCLEYAVTALKVKHIIVCGHHNCGAVKGALTMPNRQQGTGSGTVCLGPRGTDQITPGIVGAPTRGDESQFIAAMGCPWPHSRHQAALLQHYHHECCPLHTHRCPPAPHLPRTGQFVDPGHSRHP